MKHRRERREEINGKETKAEERNIKREK